MLFCCCWSKAIMFFSTSFSNHIWRNTGIKIIKCTTGINIQIFHKLTGGHMLSSCSKWKTAKEVFHKALRWKVLISSACVYFSLECLQGEFLTAFQQKTNLCVTVQLDIRSNYLWHCVIALFVWIPPLLQNFQLGTDLSHCSTRYELTSGTKHPGLISQMVHHGEEKGVALLFQNSYFVFQSKYIS